MSTPSRDKAIKLLVAKFIKLVESLDPGERLSIKKVGARKSTRGKKPRSTAKPANAAARKTKKAQPRAAK
jgi:hypothetical protein